MSHRKLLVLAASLALVASALLPAGASATIGVGPGRPSRLPCRSAQGGGRRRPGRPRRARPSTPASRSTPKAPSARPTSSSRKARASTSARPRTARGPGADGNRRLHERLAADRDPGGSDRSEQAGDARLQLLADDAGQGESDPDTCAYNDLALIRIDPADVGSVNPSVPGFGGPTGVGAAANPAPRSTRTATRNCAAGHQAEPEAGGPAAGRRRRLEPHRRHPVARHPRRLGRGFLNESGQAIGVLSTLQIAPLAGTNGVGDIGREIAYLRADGGFPTSSLCRAPSRSTATCWKRSRAPSARAPRPVRGGRGGWWSSQSPPPPRPRAGASPGAGDPSTARSRCRRGRRDRGPR